MKNTVDIPRGVTIICTFQEEIYFQTLYKTQLLVPSFGFPPEPRRCREVAEDLQEKALRSARHRPHYDGAGSKKRPPPPTQRQLPDGARLYDKRQGF